MLDLEGLQLRAALLRSIRSFFQQQHFLEVDTPIRQPVLIPEAHIEPIPSGSWFLQTSPELCMKRLLARGCSRIMQICPCFRAGEQGRLHLEEFTMLEWYRTDSDYHDLMDDCRDMLRFVLAELSTAAASRNHMSRSRFGKSFVDQDWEWLSVAEAFAKFAPVGVEEALRDKMFDQILVEHVEPNLGVSRPTFLYDYPGECASLARLKTGDQRVAERFELYIFGIELANGFSELTDAAEQRTRFNEELGRIGSDRSGPGVPERFLADLEKLEKAAGIAFGIDRLLLLLLSTDTIEEAVSFAPADLLAEMGPGTTRQRK